MQVIKYNFELLSALVKDVKSLHLKSTSIEKEPTIQTLAVKSEKSKSSAQKSKA